MLRYVVIKLDSEAAEIASEQSSQPRILLTFSFPNGKKASDSPAQPGGPIALNSMRMDSKEASGTVRKPGPKPLQSNSLRTQYLILYNFVSMILWLVVLGRVVLLVPLVGFGRVYSGVGNFAKWTQTLALLEVVHSAVGMINSSPISRRCQSANAS
jgi:hypothetical protein